MFVLGGNDGSRFFGDLWQLDTATWTWTQVETKGVAPSPRAGHTATVVGEPPHTVLVFGGVDAHGPRGDMHALALDSLTWSQPQTQGTAPSPRAGHTAVAVGGSKLLVFGGGYLDRVFNDLHLLDVESKVWARPSDSGALPGPRAGHSCTAVGPRLFIFGGGNSAHLVNDLYMLDTAFFVLPRVSSSSSSSAASSGEFSPRQPGKQRRRRSLSDITELATPAAPPLKREPSDTNSVLALARAVDIAARHLESAINDCRDRLAERRSSAQNAGVLAHSGPPSPGPATTAAAAAAAAASATAPSARLQTPSAATLSAAASLEEQIVVLVRAAERQRLAERRAAQEELEALQRFVRSELRNLREVIAMHVRLDRGSAERKGDGGALAAPAAAAPLTLPSDDSVGNMRPAPLTVPSRVEDERRERERQARKARKQTRRQERRGDGADADEHKPENE
jgi:hypothetical protein